LIDAPVILCSLFGPFLVWPIEYFLPYPYIVEELFKAAVVWFGPKKALPYAVAGVAFAFTETVLYTLNINLTGSFVFMLARFVSSALIHTLTFLIIFLSTKIDRRFIAVGFIVAVALHYVYNLYIPNFLTIRFNILTILQ
jgi:RsiW-degrading membrane proteinase PrsW (M82 family)